MRTDASTTTNSAHPARIFAKIFGPVLLLVGILGLVLGEQSLGGELNIDVVEDLIHVASGSLLMYLGFMAKDSLAKTGVMVVGAVYLLVTILGFAAPDLIEEFAPHGYSIVDNLIHLVVGVGAIATAAMSRTTHDHHVA